MMASLRARLTAGVAMVAASAVAVTASLTPPAVCGPITSHTIQLTAAVSSLGQLPQPDIIPTLSQEVQRGIVPSLGAPLPTPSIPTPAPAATNINQAIKNIYNAAEPWVRYGFELAAYAAGWVPYVGWLSPQIIIFYNFGERIVRSITFNLDDWIFGPLPFLQGLGNVARDSWNALVQLGIDELHFWLPPLPFTAQTTITPTANMPITQQQPRQAPAVPQSLSERLKPPNVSAKDTAGAPAATPHRLVSPVEQTPDGVTAEVASPLATVATPPTQNPIGAPVRKALAGTPGKAANEAVAGKAPVTGANAFHESVTDGASHVTVFDGKAPAHKPAAKRGQTNTEQKK